MNADSTPTHDQAGQPPAPASTTNGSAPPVNGPIGGPLPPAFTPLKPHLPPPEVSAVREEEPSHPATAHQIPQDDPATASAAQAVVTSENMTNGQDRVEESKPVDMQPVQAQPVETQSIDSQTTAAPSAPGTQNPYNASEETAIKAEAPIPQSEPVAKDEDVEMKDEKPNGIAPTAPEPAPSPSPAPIQAQAAPQPPAPVAEQPVSANTNAVEMKDEKPNGITPTAPAPAPISTSAAPQSSATPETSDSRRASTAVVAEDGSLPPLAGPDSTEMSGAQIRACQNAIKGLKGRNDSGLFHAPVDPIAAGVPHYFTIIKTPMDLGTVDYKLAFTAAAQKGGNKHTEKTKMGVKMGLNPLTDVYKTLEDVEKDVKLIFSNCILFNGPEHPLSKTAELLDGVFDKQMKSIIANVNDDNGAEASAAALAVARRPSEGVAAARPKRDIHPPPPKDLPYADRPQSASGSLVKRKKSRGKMSSREIAFYEKLDKDQLKYAAKVIDDFHKEPVASQCAWVFFEKPAMNLDFAQAYYNTIKNPISLKEIRQRITSGEYEDIDGPNNDMKLMFDNCFTFNEKASEVYVMGDKLRSLWEDKMAKMPRPNPPVVDDDEDEDAEDDDEFEEEDPETRMFEIREEIATLQKELERLSGKAKQAKQKASKKRRPSESAGSKKAPAAKKAKSSGSVEAKKSTGVKKAGGGGGRRDEEVREVTYEQKEELAAKITQLPDDRLDGALKIIAEDKPPNANDDEEIELDIDDLSPSTLYKLYRYVVRPKGKKVTTSKLSSSDGRKRGTGGVKRKNLDEEEEAARIARLQAQLNQFDNPDMSTSSTSAPKPATKAAGHDDLVASDSSSGEEDYESESDYE
ncbi:Bromodomain-containing protein [Meira miltonrushii]|uniref:Bromodomain-containing protein n=1 Tax=Meira miltonrushii TaxID=1280837 RepID=A0A316V6H0_9BASI|nr:Bromodomain-containing protein [Meira miltonrushii]PWN32618.1 Bromodomain-containing protein [Meira miltonrushii]